MANTAPLVPPGDDPTSSTTQDLEIETQRFKRESGSEIMMRLQEQIARDIRREQADAPAELGDDVNLEARPWRVIFQTMTLEPRVIGVDVQNVAVIGRSDPSANIQADLDLAPVGGQDQGVSRRHALLMPEETGLFLIDLDSTNGTWINGVYIQPGQKYRIQVGDRLEFGRLKIIVRVVGDMLSGTGSGDDTAITRNRPKKR